ncbi:Heat-labile enterotoxin, A chain [Metarhizium album ARSEF 1941]|uniref:Heat-labile enterotoxin, A chain n=1 Tax=Metarhizium album (strain ARSEF 1941) TaxID=1081103 RepID=A0A0B2WNV7_METAS|nr:Heat-labile enterotoxin, A chain [Metarhizium album ARSEF 1941]KHN95172.1 Heat-labile enterotoxin, A chain [Metarhizium album ARSEF 1941]
MEKYNLLSHVRGNIKNTAYVSTTTDIHTAVRYALPDGPGRRGYVYKIEPSTTFVDVNRSLRIPRYWSNMEFAAMKGIPISQVVGWVELTEDVIELLQLGKTDQIKFTENTSWKALPEWLKGGTTRPELASFPKGDKAWKLHPWKELKNARESVEVLFKKIVASEHPSVVLAAKAETELMALAETLSEKHLSAVTRRNGLKRLARGRWKMELSQVRTSVLGRVKLSEAWKVPTKGLAVAGVAAWAYGVVDAFTSESSGWDKAAAVTAIIPLAGCAANLVAGADDPNSEGVLVAVDTGLCLLGDALLLGGASLPLGILVHVSRSLLQFFRAPPKLPSVQEILKMRDDPWQSFVDQHLTNFLASKAWRDKLEASVAVEALAIWSMAADYMGRLEAVGRTVSNASHDVQEAIHQIEERAQGEVVKRQRAVLLQLPQRVRADLTVLMERALSEYNEDFIKKLNSEEVVGRYPGYSKAVGWFIPDTWVYKDSRERMRDASSVLRQNPPQLPSLLTLAYFVGVAAGVDDPPPPRVDPNSNKPGFAKFIPAEPEDWKNAVNQTVMDPSMYYAEKTGNSSSQELIRHTMHVVDCLLGKSQEQELPTTVLGLSESSHVREFQLLIAMHMGSTFADWKEARGSKVGYMHEDYQKDIAGLVERLYDIPRDSASRSISQIQRTRLRPGAVSDYYRYHVS